MQDPPPQLGPDERPSLEQRAHLARELLREMARHDRALAKRLRDEGLDDEA